MIVLQFDNNFYPWTELLLQSAVNNAPNEDIFISGVNFSSSVVEAISKYKRVILCQHIIEFPGVQERVAGVGSQAQWKILMQNRCMRVLREAYEIFGNRVYVMLDADMLIRRPLSWLNSFLSEHPIGVCMDKTHIKKKQLWASVIGVNGHMLIGRDFITDYAGAKSSVSVEYVTDDKLVSYEVEPFFDQTTLYTLCKQHIGVIPSLPYELLMRPCGAGYMNSGHSGDKDKNFKAFQDTIEHG